MLQQKTSAHIADQNIHRGEFETPFVDVDWDLISSFYFELPVNKLRVLAVPNVHPISKCMENQEPAASVRCQQPSKPTNASGENNFPLLDLKT